MRKSVALLVSLTLCLSAAPRGLHAAPQAPAADESVSGAIRGTLIDANGQPLMGYRVKVTDAAGTVFESSPTGEDGKFEIPDLPAGTYTYQIFDPQGRLIQTRMPVVNLQPGMSLTQPIAIVPKGKGKGKGTLLAWLIGGGAAVGVAAIAAGNNDSNDHHHDKSMTPSTPGGG
ncbi:MAG TPA: carboxypeptidase-like regulatory domain-containing protein [Candidatus Polarisedimenticolia bacterium]|nr:carboxypeptidase-like regulatory domain-containing protein [Candidatus Polarisedimenticolia bacterium]